ncbi:MAG: hypothetical protein SF028_05995 [Candidatus Sumerlaeia bacterium]|nr:hypothetical protein [Candidatus Sumerlaeia bacterium]
MSAPRRELWLVCSHVGGAMKSTLAALLAMEVAAAGRSVLVVDAAPAGGPSGFALFRHRGIVARTGARQAGSHATLPVYATHFPAVVGIGEDSSGDFLLPTGEEPGVTIVDLPQVPVGDMPGLLRAATQVVVPVPANAVMLRTLLGFLDELKDQRARPGREFQARVVPTGAGLGTPLASAVDKFLQTYLRPVLSGAFLPHDDGLKRAIELNDEFDPAALAPAVRSNLRLLATELLPA